MSPQRGSVAILSLLVITLLVFGGYLIYSNKRDSKLDVKVVSPTLNLEDKTHDWKTYKDSENGFSFKYPPEWEAESDEFLTTSLFKPEDKNVKFPDTIRLGITSQLMVRVSSDQTFEQIEKYLDLTTPSETLQGKQTLRYATGIYILLDPSTNKVLQLSRLIYPDENEYLNIIISTLKFD